MRPVIRGFMLLRGPDRARYVFAILAKLSLVALDLVGLIFIGLAATMLLDAEASKQISGGALSRAASFFGVQNTYAFIAGLAVLFFIVKAALSLFLNSKIANFVARVESELSSSIFAGYLRSGLESQSRWSNNQIVQGVQDGAFNAFSASLMTFSVIAGEIALLISISTFLFITSPLLALFVSVYLGFFALLISRYINGVTSSSSEILQETSLGMHSILGDAMGNYRQIFLSTSIKNYISRYSLLRKRHSLHQSKIALMQYVPRYVLEAALMLGFAGVMFQRAIDGGVALPLGTIAIFFAGVFRIVGSILPLQAGLATLKRIEVDSRVSYEMVREFRKPVAVRSSSGLEKKHELNIEINEVTYKYPKSKKAAIRNLTYSIPQGAFIAIRGKSGVGKSTLADLLLGLLEPSSGKISIGDISPRRLQEEFPNVIGYVPQKTYLIHGTLLDNITMEYDSPAEKRLKVKKLLSQLGLDDLVKSLPRGLSTQMGSGEFNLSGGQLQRVGLARALYKSPRILILDEVTSSLDRESEDLIDKCIESLRGKITIISISHRESRIHKNYMQLNL